MTDAPRSLDEAEGEAVLSDLAALRDRPPAGDSTSGGCAVAIVAIVAIVMMPFIGRAFDLPGPLMGALGLLLVATAVGAGMHGIFGGGPDRTPKYVSRAVVDLLSDETDASRRRMAALELLDGAYTTRGSTMVQAYDREEVASHLGDALEYVRRVERFLRDRDEIHAVFTRYPDTESKGDAAPEGDPTPV